MVLQYSNNVIIHVKIKYNSNNYYVFAQLIMLKRSPIPSINLYSKIINDIFINLVILYDDCMLEI